jgi:hypothetical protein
MLREISQTTFARSIVSDPVRAAQLDVAALFIAG